MNIKDLYLQSYIEGGTGLAKKEAKGVAKAHRFVKNRLFNALYGIPEVKEAFNLTGAPLEQVGSFGKRVLKGRSADRARFMQQLPSTRWDPKDVEFLTPDGDQLLYNNAGYNPDNHTIMYFAQPSLIAAQVKGTRNQYRNFDPITILAHEYGHGLLGSIKDPVLAEKARIAILKAFPNLLSQEQKYGARAYNYRLLTGFPMRPMFGVTKSGRRHLRKALRKNGATWSDLYENRKGDEFFADTIGALVGKPSRNNLQKALNKHASKIPNLIYNEETGTYYKLNPAEVSPEVRKKIINGRLHDNISPDAAYIRRSPRNGSQQFYRDLKQVFPKGILHGLDKYKVPGRNDTYLDVLKSSKDSGIAYLELPEEIARKWHDQLQSAYKQNRDNLVFSGDRAGVTQDQIAEYAIGLNRFTTPRYLYTLREVDKGVKARFAKGERWFDD